VVEARITIVAAMPVQFKFRGEKAFRSLLNVTTPCTLQRVKSAIYEQARISDSSTDLTLDDASTNKALDARALLVPDALVQLVVRRTPFQQDTLALAMVPFSSTDVSSSAAQECLAIDRVVDQHNVNNMALLSAPQQQQGFRYNRSYNLALSNATKRKREGYDGESDDDDVFEVADPPPPTYTCYRCGTVGGKPESHWVLECTTNKDPDHVCKIRTARGVPRAFLQKVSSIEEGQEKSAGGVTFTLPGHSGHYIIAHQEASYEDKKLRLGDTVQEKVTAAFSDGAKRVEESLKCPLCSQMFRQAMLVPCCGATYCSDCVVDRLAHSSVDNSCCPGCGNEVLVHQLIVNEDIRRQVEQVTRSSQAMAIASNKKQEHQLALKDSAPSSSQATTSLSLTAALKDRINRPRKHAAETGGEGSEALALTDRPAAGEGMASGPSWQPLGLGPMLARENFSAWKSLVRTGAPHPTVKAQFEDWQKKMREFAGPALKKATSSSTAATSAPTPGKSSARPSAPVTAPASMNLPAQAAAGASAPPSEESFKEWQRMLRERRTVISSPSEGSSGGGARKRARKSKRRSR